MANAGVLPCGCKLLLMAGMPTNPLTSCDPRGGRPEIELTFDEPQTILDVTFFNVQDMVSKFIYIMEDGEEVFVTIPMEGGGFGEPSKVDISRQQFPAPVNVKAIRLHGF